MAEALSKAEQVARAMEGQQMKRNRWLSMPAVIFITGHADVWDRRRSRTG